MWEYQTVFTSWPTLVISLQELKDVLRNEVEETQFLELLDITTADLVMMFDDKIADRFDYLVSKLELDEDDERVVDVDDRN